MAEYLDETTLRPALFKCSFAKQLYVFKEIDSTNDFLKNLCLTETPIEGTLVYAEQQTQGRGRFSRSWDSPAGKGLWFSLLFLPKMPTLDDVEWTQLGVKACQKAVQNLTNIQLDIRWPNDLYFSDKKVGGILTELIRHNNAIQRVIMGIGINTNQILQDFDPSIRETAISLRMINHKEINRLELLVRIVQELENDYLSKSGKL